MRRILHLASCFSVIFLVACGEPQPVSTGSKSPPLAATTSTTTTTPATGDPTKGLAIVTASCNTAGCHGTGAHAFVKADSGKIATSGTKSYHSSVVKVFTDSGSDISAYLETK